MKFYKPITGEERIIRRFAWWPTRVMETIVWLEWVTLHQTYNTGKAGWNNDWIIEEERMEDSLDYAKMINADNIKLVADLEKVKAERDAAIKDLEKIMFRGGTNTDTCSYCSNNNCYNRGGCEICSPVWNGRQHAPKLLNCGECDLRFTCQIETEDCSHLYHPASKGSNPSSAPHKSI